jgi:pimeloyl-ACP methyl ester carboxylesterase
MNALVVYVHGLWLNGWEAAWLRRRLRQRLGCATRVFHYPSVTADLKANARALGGFLARMRADTLHLVGHSMGGSVILEFFEGELSPGGVLQNGFPLPPGRIVLLASPVSGSRVAQRLARRPFGRAIMGATAAQVLLEPPARRWNGARELAVIAGDLSLGLGQLMGRIDAPNDGTVLVEETRLAGAKEHMTLPVSHSGMMLSAKVASQTAAFLRDGRFEA